MHPILETDFREAPEWLNEGIASHDSAFRNADEDLHYATARYLCQWLDERGQLWPFYQRFRDGHEADPGGERAFQAVTGKTVAEADEEWGRWVKRL